MAKAAFKERKTLLERKITTDAEKKLIKALIRRIAYDAETWALKKTDIHRTEALEMLL